MQLGRLKVAEATDRQILLIQMLLALKEAGNVLLEDRPAPERSATPELGACRFQWVVHRRPEKPSEPLGISFIFTEGRWQADATKPRMLADNKTKRLEAIELP